MESINKVELLEEIIYHAPLVLLTLEDEEMINLANDYLPYSTGFEIECHYGPNYNKTNFESIPNIIKVSNDSSEQRYRIPFGIKGILCLYNISQQLKLNSLLNPGSGIHIHVDMTDTVKRKYEDKSMYGGLIPEAVWIMDNQAWILDELDTWGYKGTYNTRTVIQHKGGWLGFRGSTAEFRCGEMTFEYNELLKNIVSANSIIKRVKAAHGFEYVGHPIEELDAEAILAYSAITDIREANTAALHQRLKALQAEMEVPHSPNKYEEMMGVIRNRVIKI